MSNSTLTIPDGCTLVVESGAKLEIGNGSNLVNNGNFVNNGWYNNNGNVEVASDYTLTKDFTVEAGKTLTVKDGATLTIPSGRTLTINEGATVSRLGSGKIVNNGTFNHTHNFVNCVCSLCGAKDTRSTTITYTVSPTYTVTIPEEVTLGNTATIEAENVVIDEGKRLEIALTGTSGDSNAFTVTTTGGATLAYTVSKGDNAVAVNDTVLAS